MNSRILSNSLLIGCAVLAATVFTAPAWAQSLVLGDYVLYATEELNFKGGLGPGGMAEINGGHVGVKLIDTNDPVLAIGVNHPVTMADNTEVVAHSMRINSNTSVYDLYVNDFYGTGDPTIRNLGPIAFDATILPDLEPAPTCTPGVDDIVVEVNGTLNLPAGGYNNVNPKDGSTLILESGVYNFRTLLCGQNVRIITKSNTEIRVAERVALNDGYCVGPLGAAVAVNVTWWVCSETVPTSDTSFHFGKDGVFNGDVRAPNGLIALGNGTQICGSVHGRKIRSDLGVIMNPSVGCYCETSVPVEPTTWGAVKSLYR